MVHQPFLRDLLEHAVLLLRLQLLFAGHPDVPAFLLQPQGMVYTLFWRGIGWFDIDRTSVNDVWKSDSIAPRILERKSSCGDPHFLKDYCDLRCSYFEHSTLSLPSPPKVRLLQLYA